MLKNTWHISKYPSQSLAEKRGPGTGAVALANAALKAGDIVAMG